MCFLVGDTCLFLPSDITKKLTFILFVNFRGFNLRLGKERGRGGVSKITDFYPFWNELNIVGNQKSNPKIILPRLRLGPINLQLDIPKVFQCNPPPVIYEDHEN